MTDLKAAMQSVDDQMANQVAQNTIREVSEIDARAEIESSPSFKKKKLTETIPNMISQYTKVIEDLETRRAAELKTSNEDWDDKLAEQSEIIGALVKQLEFNQERLTSYEKSKSEAAKEIKDYYADQIADAKTMIKAWEAAGSELAKEA